MNAIDSLKDLYYSIYKSRDYNHIFAGGNAGMALIAEQIGNIANEISEKNKIDRDRLNWEKKIYNDHYSSDEKV